jgi:hypothetical protein
MKQTINWFNVYVALDLDMEVYKQISGEDAGSNDFKETINLEKHLEQLRSKAYDVREAEAYLESLLIEGTGSIL